MLKELIEINLFWVPRFLSNKKFCKIYQSFPTEEGSSGTCPPFRAAGPREISGHDQLAG